jgi:PadR family transcriptional regulator PadR
MISRTLMAASTRPIILAILSRNEDYGYNLIQKVKEFSGGTIDWKEGMIYPVLQRMEVDGLISSQWKMLADERPRRYFRITERGRLELASELTGWGNVCPTPLGIQEGLRIGKRFGQLFGGRYRI